jgi:hypothetical protein
MAQPEITIAQYLRDNIDKYEYRAELVSACVDALGVAKKSVRSRLTQILKELDNENRENSCGLKSAISADDFRKANDLTIKVKEALKNLGKHVIYDSDFKREMGIKTDKWKMVSEKIDPEEKYRLKVKGKTIWGHPDVLKKIEATIDII